MILESYKKKRDFKKTPEPPYAKASGGGPRADKLIFVIHEHHASHLHWDFRLEMEGVLRSWAVPKGPSFDPKTKRLARLVEDHPLDYASFSGIIPKGQYGAGKVEIWDKGTYEPQSKESKNKKELGKIVQSQFEDGRIHIQMYGKRMKGGWALIRTKDPKNRLLFKIKNG